MCFEGSAAEPVTVWGRPRANLEQAESSQPACVSRQPSLAIPSSSLGHSVDCLATRHGTTDRTRLRRPDYATATARIIMVVVELYFRTV